MSDLSVVTVFLLLLSVLIAAMAIPGAWLQLVKVKREGTSEGLSTVFIAMGASSASSWFTYGFLAKEPLQIVVNSSGSVAQLLTLALMARYLPRLRVALLIVGAYIAVMAVTGLAFGPGIIGAAGTALGILCRVPQVYKSWREPGGAAISIANFSLACSSSVLWIVFGAINNDPFVLVSASLSILLSGYIIARTLRANSYEEQAELAVA